MPGPIDLFFSYSHKDEALRDELAAHLAMLKRREIIRTWHDRQIGAGQDWKDAIDARLESAQIILLLVSADFLASDYCYDVEMRRALERHQVGKAVVLPVILRPCDWTEAPFSRLQAVPRDAKPVVAWSSHDEAWVDVVRAIREAALRVSNPF